ncbi:hypothetical protein EN868_11175 [Mesorhizobium sp. M2D.F.Ca.ET.225.01.1.1]|uniref:hypothetical protein n=1 Tax=unclassified Mesorhizobium TaxID=325217 RepID=UPI000FD5F70D|nr:MULTISPECIES: hypothetical protein [unclassified Mesorhizobium]TGP59546.1 hypothetical protein EN869_014845 [Mesorhizobium sp. M2D.F.Ca.ET.226.01.1.1]TGP69181.1 hypothetical protein EN868_11175 [Mesorhizobium sp. M2D.F.Ca.ET.225.01.1.1]
MSDQFTTLEGLDASIEKARSGAIALASKVKQLRTSIRDRLISNGTDAKARELRSQLAELSADQAFSEEHLAALHERRAAIAAETEAARAAAERAAKVDAFRAQVGLQLKAAQRVDDLIAKLAAAANELSAATTDLQVAASTVGLPRAAVDGHESIRVGIDASLRACGAFGFLFTFNPKGRLDDQGRSNLATISERVQRSGAELVSRLEV